MTAIATRSGSESLWGRKPPKQVAYYVQDWHVGWRPVTWKEVHAPRVERQRWHLRKIRSISRIRPGFVWVFYLKDLYAGWWVYIRTLEGDFALNFASGYGPWAKNKADVLGQAMSIFPCGTLPILELWAPAFAKAFKSHRNTGLALVNCHIDECGALTHISERKGTSC